MRLYCSLGKDARRRLIGSAGPFGRFEGERLAGKQDRFGQGRGAAQTDGPLGAAGLAADVEPDCEIWTV